MRSVESIIFRLKAAETQTRMTFDLFRQRVDDGAYARYQGAGFITLQVYDGYRIIQRDHGEKDPHNREGVVITPEGEVYALATQVIKEEKRTYHKWQVANDKHRAGLLGKVYADLNNSRPYVTRKHEASEWGGLPLENSEMVWAVKLSQPDT